MQRRATWIRAQARIEQQRLQIATLSGRGTAHKMRARRPRGPRLLEYFGREAVAAAARAADFVNDALREMLDQALLESTDVFVKRLPRAQKHALKPTAPRGRARPISRQHTASAGARSGARRSSSIASTLHQERPLPEEPSSRLQTAGRGSSRSASHPRCRYA